MLLWGGTFVSGRALALNFHPFVIAFLRFFSASICLLIMTKIHLGRLPRLSTIQVLKVSLLGLTGVFSYNFFFFKGLSLIEAGRASVIIATNPTITALLAALFLKEKLTFRKVLGVLLALTGAFFVITEGNLSVLSEGFTRFGLGELSLLGAVLSWVSYTLIGKVALKKLSPLEATTYACTIGTVFLIGPALHFGLWQSLPNLKPLDWFNVFYLGVLATSIGFIFYYQGIKTIGAARASAFINFVPLFGVLSGVLFLGEIPSKSLYIGAALVISGVSLTNASKRR